MELSDLIVEVRDKNYVRQGLILPEDLSLSATDLFNNVGTWKLDLPYEHPMTPLLRTPGAGLIITMPNDLVFSGPVVAPTVRTSQSNPQGTVTFEGVSDDIILSDYLAWPDPSNVDPTAQSVAYDVRSGNAEFLLHEYVNANLGPGAPSARIKAGLTMGTDLNRGTATKYAARFEKLGQVLANIAATTPGLGFRVVQRGDGLVFETYMAADKSDVVRLDIYNRTTQSQEVAVSAPTATKVIIGGSGEATDRNFYLGTSTEADTAETDWGRRIERFVDQRQSDDSTEYASTAGQILNDEGKTIVGAKMTPGDDTTMSFGTDWAPGDYIGIVFADGEAQAVVTGYSLIADQQGLRVGILLGDTTQFDVNAAVAKQTSNLASRLDKIERNDATAGYDLSGLTQARIEAAEALAAADAAQTTADGRNTVYFQTSAPTGGTYSVDDLWYDTDNGYALSRWDGVAWTAAPYGTGALGAGSVTASILAAGSVVAGKIAANAISANELQADSVTSAKIAAGAVVAGKIAALAVTAGTIAADAVTANEIAANSVGTAELDAGAVTAAKIAAGTITANEIAANTITTAKLSSTAIDGMTITGAVFRTAASGLHLTIDSSTSNKVTFYSGSGSETSPGYVGVTSLGVLFLEPGVFSSSGSYAAVRAQRYSTIPSQVMLDADEIVLNYNNTVGSYTHQQKGFILVDGAANNTTGNKCLTFDGGTWGDITFWADNDGSTTRLWINIDDGNRCYIGPRAGGTNKMERIQINTGIFTIPNFATTTGSGANLFYNTSGGALARSTSALKYKTDLREMPDPKWDLLNLNPYAYKGTGDGDTNFGTEPSRDYWGLIAEDLDELGFHELVHYDDNGEIDALQYERIAPLFIPMIRDLKQRIEALEAASA